MLGLDFQTHLLQGAGPSGTLPCHTARPSSGEPCTVSKRELLRSILCTFTERFVLDLLNTRALNSPKVTHRMEHRCTLVFFWEKERHYSFY